MTTYAAFIRGINVGGNNQIRMADLKSTCESAGLANVRTLLQSGNVVFDCKRGDPAAIIEKAIPMDVRVIARTAYELRDVIARNPFDEDRNPSLLIVFFLEKAPSKEALAALKAAMQGPEELHASGRELFVYYPDGMGKSKFTNVIVERKLGMAATARNWNTVMKVVGMVSGELGG